MSPVSSCPICDYSVEHPVCQATLADEKLMYAVEVLAYRCENGHVWISCLPDEKAIRTSV